VIAADGVESLVARWAGVETTLPACDLMVCAQYLLAGVEVDPFCCRYVIDEAAAPGGYAWVFPKGPDRANVGLGIQADLMHSRRSVREMLDGFVESDRRLSRGSPVTLITGGVPVSPPLDELVSDGLMVIGDAAHQVDPFTGGGIITGMTAGRLAAQVAVQCLARGDVSAAALGAYAIEWNDGQGRKARRSYRWRERFPPGRRASKSFVRAFAAAVSGL
jgi:digeranylgeranylglycerophospholipid reductase